MRRKITSILLACILLVALSVQVFADDISISFDLLAVAKGNYDKVVDVSIAAGSASKISVEKLYIKTAQSNSIKFKPTKRIAKTLYRFLTTDATKNLSANTEISPADLVGISVSSKELTDAQTIETTENNSQVKEGNNKLLSNLKEYVKKAFNCCRE